MLKDQLQKHFGFTSFLKGQEEVIRKVLARQSAAAIFPTGAGKSLCYQLPAMVLPGLTLVVSPLLSLMKDQLDFLLSNDIPAARLDSTLGKNEYNAILESAKNNRIKILMIAVERFKNERFRSHLQKMDVTLLVVDEAHCISEWGHNFRPEYLNLPYYQKEFNIGQTLLLTATATQRVIEDMCTKFDILTENVFVTGFYRNNLFLQVTPTAASEKKNRLLQRIHNMVGFFESKACISRQLAGYFGEYLEIERCGHCSFCKNGKAVLPDTSELKPLSNFEFREITNEFIEVVGEQFSEVNLTKFLCGIYTPVFSKLKIKKLPHFGILENYPFKDVKNWIKNNTTESSD